MIHDISNNDTSTLFYDALRLLPEKLTFPPTFLAFSAAPLYRATN